MSVTSPENTSGVNPDERKKTLKNECPTDTKEYETATSSPSGIAITETDKQNNNKKRFDAMLDEDKGQERRKRAAQVFPPKYLEMDSDDEIFNIEIPTKRVKKKGSKYNDTIPITSRSIWYVTIETDSFSCTIYCHSLKHQRGLINENVKIVTQHSCAISFFNVFQMLQRCER